MLWSRWVIFWAIFLLVERVLTVLYKTVKRGRYSLRYTKKTNADDSGEHLLELGYVLMRNLLPNQPYQDVLMPSEVQRNMPIDRQRTLRIFCREKPPCGGISIIEHFEINVVPLNICESREEWCMSFPYYVFVTCLTVAVFQCWFVSCGVVYQFHFSPVIIVTTSCNH